MAISKDKRRKTSNEKYVDALQEKHSKLCVLRVDLHYNKNNRNDVTLDEANKNIDRLLANRRNNAIFEDNVGYIIKTEYGEDREIHFHTFFFFDGQKVKKDAYKADEIGDYWNSSITKGKGTYYNCNRNDYKDNKAIGMLDYRDEEKREKLDYAMAYLAKEEQSIEAIKENKNDRSIRRGTMPKEKNTKGRRRNK